MDWLGQMIGLPACFLHSDDAASGGVIQTTASESTLVCLLAARSEAIRRHQSRFPGAKNGEVNGKVVAYCSDQAHSSVDKAGLIGLVQIRHLESDDKLSLRGETLKQAIHEDREKGLIPFFVRQ